MNKLSKNYDPNFHPTQEWLRGMPDMQNEPFDGRYIDMVGITNFRVPIKIRQRDGETQQVLASIHGFTDVQSSKLGLNMSRLIRTFYKSKDDVFDINKLETILKGYKKDQDAFNANLQIEFDYYIQQQSLLSKDDSGNPYSGYYTVHCVIDASLDQAGVFHKQLKVYWQYSSACKCSTALSEYAGETLGLGANPHSQRSTAAITIKFQDFVWIEDIIDHCRKSLVTECQSIVKREDECWFAVLNYAHQKFIEDATRLLAKELDTNTSILDYKVLMCHAESLHQSSVVGLITKGIEGSEYTNHVSSAEMKELLQMC